MTLTQIIQTIKTDKNWRKVFISAKYWENERARLDYVDNPEPTPSDIENWEVAQRQFSYYYKQLGVGWDVWTQIKAKLGN